MKATSFSLAKLGESICAALERSLRVLALGGKLDVRTLHLTLFALAVISDDQNDLGLLWTDSLRSVSWGVCCKIFASLSVIEVGRDGSLLVFLNQRIDLVVYTCHRHGWSAHSLWLFVEFFKKSSGIVKLLLML